MTRIFGVDFPQLMKQVVAPGLPSYTLVKSRAGTRADDDSTGGVRPTTSRVRFRGVIEELRRSREDDTLVQRRRVRMLILAATLPSRVEPEVGDKIEADRVTYNVHEVPTRDPASATFVCLATQA